MFWPVFIAVEAVGVGDKKTGRRVLSGRLLFV